MTFPIRPSMILLVALTLIVACAGTTEHPEDNDSASGVETERTGAESATFSTAAADATGQARSAERTRRALIVAVSDYSTTNYKNLNAHNDVPLLVAALKRHGFRDNEIRILQDRDATKEGILAALDQLAQETQPGDVIFFHYSGHGNYMTDNNGDEIDGYDEVLVAYGADALERDPNYDGSKHVRDDDLEPRVLALRRAAGSNGNVLFSIDACHSGTATRGTDVLPTRGGENPIGPPAATAQSTRGSAREGVESLIQTSGVGTRGDGRNGQDDAGLAPYVVFAAASPQQQANETFDDSGKERTKVGAFTLGFTRALAQAGPNMSYRTLYEQVNNAVQDAIKKHGGVYQVPQIEGDVNTAVFSGLAIRQEPYFRVQEVAAPQEVKLNAGLLLGLAPGATVAFHPADATDAASSRALATGEVTDATQLTATVQVNKALDEATFTNARVFVTAYPAEQVAARVKLGSSLSAEQRAALKDALEKSGFARIVTDNHDLEVTGGNVLAMKNVVDMPVGKTISASGANYMAQVVEEVKNYARYQYVRDLSTESEAYKVDLELIPVRFTSDEGCAYEELPAGNRFRDGKWHLKPGDGYVLKFTNNGTKTAYLSLINLMPDASISVLYPFEEESLSQSNYVRAGQSFIPPDVCFEVDDIQGTEVLKLFATKNHVDFHPIATRSATRGTRDAMDPFEQLLEDAYTPTRSTTRRKPAGEGHTATVLIEVGN